jgi:hypothetical protein
MAHPDTAVSEAVDVQPADDDAAALDAFDAILSEEEEGEAEEPEPEDGEELEEEADEGEEPVEPAIPAPVSWSKEEKALFETLTPEQQRGVAAIEARRNGDVQKATTEAAEAKRNAMSEAETAVAQIQRQYAAELAQYAKAFEVPEPDYSLLATNPQAFAEQLAYHKQSLAQRDQLAQQSADAMRQAEAAEREAVQRWEAKQVEILAREIPEWGDLTQRRALLENVASVGKDLGYDDEAMSNLDARDILALRRVVGDRDKASKYDKLMADKMAGVRAAKGQAPITAKPGTAQPKGSGQRRALADATSRLRQTGSDADALAAFEAMGL